LTDTQFALHVVGDRASPRVRSGALDLERGLSSGKQEFETDEKQWPVNKPTIKVEARAQCSGIHRQSVAIFCFPMIVD